MFSSVSASLLWRRPTVLPPENSQNLKVCSKTAFDRSTQELLNKFSFIIPYKVKVRIVGRAQVPVKPWIKGFRYTGCVSGYFYVVWGATSTFLDYSMRNFSMFHAVSSMIFFSHISSLPGSIDYSYSLIAYILGSVAGNEYVMITLLFFFGGGVPGRTVRAPVSVRISA